MGCQREHTHYTYRSPHSTARSPGPPLPSSLSLLPSLTADQPPRLPGPWPPSTGCPGLPVATPHLPTEVLDSCRQAGHVTPSSLTPSPPLVTISVSLFSTRELPPQKLRDRCVSPLQSALPLQSSLHHQCLGRGG